MDFDVKREAIEKVEWSGDIHKRVSVTNSGCSDSGLNSQVIVIFISYLLHQKFTISYNINYFIIITSEIPVFTLTHLPEAWDK